MKYIEKTIDNEPETLKKYRDSTPGASYAGYADADQSLKKALIEEQGGVCAYCTRRISLKRNKKTGKPRVEVEHYRSQHNYPSEQLAYSNMLGVCNGDLFNSEHCDKSKKQEDLIILNPLEKRCESLVTYTSGGEIKAVHGPEEVEKDISLLSLNNQNLIEARKSAIDIALKRLSDKNKSSTWTKMLIQKEIDFWAQRNKDNKFHPYCQVAIWFWKNKQRSSRYPAR